jgi:hypothetical protein
MDAYYHALDLLSRPILQRTKYVWGKEDELEVKEKPARVLPLLRCDRPGGISL